jgi:hypothetical protein
MAEYCRLARDTSFEPRCRRRVFKDLGIKAFASNRLLIRKPRSDGNAVVFMVGGCNSETFPELVAGTQVPRGLYE